MKQPATSPSRWLSFGNTRLLCVIVCGLSTTGCQQRGYVPSSLPAAYTAPPTRHAQQLHLSSLGRLSVDGERIEPGDTLLISITTGLETEKPHPHRLRVNSDGRINLPLVGEVPVAGLRLSAADVAVRQASIERNIYRAPLVSVQREGRETISVSVTGEVTSPGKYKIPVNARELVSALVAAKGLTEKADTIVEIRHPPQLPPNSAAALATVQASFAQSTPAMLGPRTLRIDLLSAAENGSGDLHLEDGSIVTVLKRPVRAVYVTGLVKENNEYPMSSERDFRLLDALTLAGGRTLEIADKVHVIRKVPDHPEPIVIRCSVRAAKKDGVDNLLLAPGDIVSVEETPTTFVLETVRSFVRFGFSSAVF